MPSTDYAAGASIDQVANGNNYSARVHNKTATGFRITIFAAGVDPAVAAAYDSAFSFQVFSSNALPPKAGTGADAWVLTDGAASPSVLGSFNVASVTRPSGSGNGYYRVNFTTPMLAPTMRCW